MICVCVVFINKYGSSEATIIGLYACPRAANEHTAPGADSHVRREVGPCDQAHQGRAAGESHKHNPGTFCSLLNCLHVPRPFEVCPELCLSHDHHSEILARLSRAKTATARVGSGEAAVLGKAATNAKTEGHGWGGANEGIHRDQRTGSTGTFSQTWRKKGE